VCNTHRVSMDSLERYRSAATRLHDIAKPMRVLSRLSWPAQIRERFVAGGAARLPEPDYASFDPMPVLDAVGDVRRDLHAGASIDDWLLRECDAIATTARMLAAVGTAGIHEHSGALYGTPTRPLRYDPTTPLELARRIHDTIDQLADARLLRPAIRDCTSDQVAGVLRPAVADHFGDDAPEVLIVDELSANAVATATRIKIRRDAKFTRNDARQLLHHEAHIHVATSLNGRAQTDLPILAIGHPGTTRTQEGLAVYSEYLSGTLELDRLRRLADRIEAVQLVVDGADFIECYQWFLERTDDPEQSFESTRRIFRGAPITGGAPFTKDCTYLSGFLSVATFVRAAFVAGRADTIPLLFAGKLDLFAVPALAELRALGLCRPARFVPPWAANPGWVLSHLTLTTFMNGIDLERVSASVADLLAATPQVEIRLPEPA